MKNLVIERVVKIRAYFTAEAWGLYTETQPVGSRVMAQALNTELETRINRGEDRETVTRFMHSLMEHNAEYGCFDTEPRYFLGQVLNEIYGDAQAS